MLLFTFLNTSQNDWLLYGGLILGTIVVIGLVTSLIGYEENQNDLNEEYDDDEEFAKFAPSDDDDFWEDHDIHEHNDDCDHHDFHDDCDHDD